MKTRHDTRDLFIEKVLSRWDNFNPRSFHIHDHEGQKVVERVYEFKITEHVLNYKDAEERVFSHSM